MKSIQTKENEMIRIQKSEYKKAEFVDIRKYWRTDSNDEWKPGNKGITIPLDEWEKFVDAINGLDV